MKRLVLISTSIFCLLGLVRVSAQQIQGIDTVVLNSLRSRVDTFTLRLLDTVVDSPLFSHFKTRFNDSFRMFPRALTRPQEFGLEHGYFLGNGGEEWNVYAMNDTIITLTFVPKSETGLQPQRIIYNSIEWERWYTQIDSLYGNIDSIPIDSASLEEYKILTSLSMYYPIRTGGGYSGSPSTGYSAAGRLYCRKDVNTLRHVLRGPNVEGRLLALMALRALDGRRRERVNERLYFFAREWSYLKGSVLIQNGCVFKYVSVGEAAYSDLSFDRSCFR